jgi:hypothetical protein
MVQGTNFSPILQGKGAKKNVSFCNALILSLLYISLDSSMKTG